VGSQAYGLDTEDSDVDRRGVFVLPTRDVLGLRPVVDTLDHTDPDWVIYEVAKFMRLALKGNPSIIELMFMESYEVLEPEGRLLVDNRAALLSEPAVRAAFGGYAMAQARKLLKREAEGREGFGPRTKNRYAKHARHCFRLLGQGRELLETGTLTVRVTNRDELFAVGEMPSQELAARFEEELAAYNEVASVLPAQPDLDRAEEVLLAIRAMNP
jgi:predicted nucleotidyltransferase